MQTTTHQKRDDLTSQFYIAQEEFFMRKNYWADTRILFVYYGGYADIRLDKGRFTDLFFKEIAGGAVIFVCRSLTVASLKLVSGPKV